MKKLIIVVLLFWACEFLSSCNHSPESQNKSSIIPTVDNSRNSLDWGGIYRGVLPCADCQGIQTTVYLNKDLSYRLKLKHLGKGSNTLEYSGKFIWNTDGNTITLDKSEGNSQIKYFVGENTLTQLDASGKKFTGSRRTAYILSKANYAILEKYWKLIELYGKPVILDSNSGREPHIILKDHDNRVNGNGGCNTISGNFEVRGVNRISFSRIITTQMACPGMDIESQFVKALTVADNFSLSGEELVLNKGRMAPLARFKTVYLK